MRQCKSFVSESVRCLIACSICLLFVLVGENTPAQSGRKMTKPNSKPEIQTTVVVEGDKEKSPPSSQSKDNTSTETKTSKTEQKLTPFLVSSDIIPANVFVRLGWVVKACQQRLEQSPETQVASGGELRRKDAIVRAKDEKETYVVWLKLDIDATDTENPAVSIGPIGERLLMVQYIVFEPQTGKAKLQGHVYLHPPGGKTGGIVVSGPQSQTYDVETLYRQAGRETANRILSALNLTLPK